MADTSPSPYHALATHNYPPTPSQAIIVQERLATLTHQRQDLAQVIQHTHIQLHDITEEILELRRACAPIRRLPLEALGEIFLRIPTSKMRPNNYQKVIRKVSLVCKSWRDAARLTARLWSDIWVKADAPSLSYDSLVAWTKRAGSIPKNIEVSSSVCGGVDWDLCEIACAGRQRCLFSNPAIARLLKQAPGTWSSVAFNFPTKDCLVHLLASLEQVPRASGPSAWDSIRAFDFLVSSRDHWLWDSESPLFSVLPSTVKDLRLHFPTWSSDHPIFHEVWRFPLSIPQSILNGLTSLELNFKAVIIATSSIFTALEHCINLETLKMYLSGAELLPPEEAGFPSRSMTLPKLKTLELRQVAPEPPSIRVLQSLKLPKLIEMFLSLDLDTEIDAQNWDWEALNLDVDIEDDPEYSVAALADFIRGDRASPSQLQRLHLRGATLYDGALFHILRDLDALTHLKLEWMALGSPDSDDFFSLLKDKPKRLPRLETIEISNLKHPTENEIPFLRFFVEERGIGLKLALHDREAWEENDKRFLYLVGLESDSEDEYGEPHEV